jgi:hypothetical protein
MKVALSNLLMGRNRKRNAFEVEEELQFHVEMLERKYIENALNLVTTKGAQHEIHSDDERHERGL